jgi:hypothetical protein
MRPVGSERHGAYGDTGQEGLRHPPHGVRRQRRGDREHAGDPRQAAGRGGRPVQDGGVHQVGVHHDRGDAALGHRVRGQRQRADQQGGARGGAAQQFAAGDHGERHEERSAAVEEHDRIVGLPHAQSEPPQQQPAGESGERDPHVEAAGAGQSYGHGTIQHGARIRRLILADGPGLHLSMYRGFIGGDDGTGRSAREPERVTEGSEP